MQAYWFQWFKVKIYIFTPKQYINHLWFVVVFLARSFKIFWEMSCVSPKLWFFVQSLLPLSSARSVIVTTSSPQFEVCIFRAVTPRVGSPYCNCPWPGLHWLVAWSHWSVRLADQPTCPGTPLGTEAGNTQGSTPGTLAYQPLDIWVQNVLLFPRVVCGKWITFVWNWSSTTVSGQHCW